LMPQQRLYSIHIRAVLDMAAMTKCLDFITGTHDFASFETAGSRDLSSSGARGSTRTILEACILNSSCDAFCFSIRGDGFLRHMVRNIVGTVLEVGLGRRTVAGFIEALHSKKRSAAGTMAPAHGLTLRKIYY